VLLNNGKEESFYIFIEKYINENQYEEIVSEFNSELVNLESLVIKTGKKQYTYLNMKNVERINIR